MEKVAEYIAQQEAHHRAVTLQEEYRRLLESHGIGFDERYVWDRRRNSYVALTGLKVRTGVRLTQAVGLGWARSPLWGWKSAKVRTGVRLTQAVGLGWARSPLWGCAIAKVRSG